ncbi:MAG TPA: DUF4921 family protein [bacterium]|nr:DUF4921 family protein [bacterium]
MRPDENLYQTLPDGTLKHVHPVSRTEVWTVPSRAHRPFHRPTPPVHDIVPQSPENYCDFCAGSYLRTPPEKSRLIRGRDGVQRLDQLGPDLYDQSQALFRRVANLFEIVTLDYWVKNHGFQPSAEQKRRRQAYWDNPKGRAHVIQMVETKLTFAGYSPDELKGMSDAQKLGLGDAFFFGSHDLIIAGPHYVPGARKDNQYFSSGEMTPGDHREFFRFTLDALRDLQDQNPGVRYVSVFQNWLQPAGASLNHLHKQLVGMDEWGVSIHQAVKAVQANPRLFNEQILGPARKRGLVLAENSQAVALCEWGHRYPTLAIYSKSEKARPEDHSPDELGGLSDLVQACHAATGNQIPCNEEWFFTPRDSKAPLPWHVLIKWRTLNQAGFEGGTKIYINPLSPQALRDKLSPVLLDLREKGRIADMRIAEECGKDSSPLRYDQGGGA